MTLGDFALSGLCERPMNEVGPIVLASSWAWPILELQVWNHEGKFSRLRPTESDWSSVGALEWDCISSFACVFDLLLQPRSSRCVLNFERWNGCTVLRGLVYLAELIAEGCPSETVLRTLAAESSRICRQLDAAFLGLAYEDHSNWKITEEAPALAPSVFFISLASGTGPIGLTTAERLESTFIEWLHDPKTPLAELKLDSPSTRQCRRFLRSYFER